MSVWIVTEMIEICNTNGCSDITCNVLGVFNTREQAEVEKSQYKPPKATFNECTRDYEVDIVKIGQGSQYTTIGISRRSKCGDI